MTEKVVTIFGTARAKPNDWVYTLAYETGKLLAQAGLTIANGGYGGMMLASAKGAVEAGGETIGVTCSAFTGTPNEYINREIVTDSLEERLGTLIKSGQGYVVLPGGTGTLLELAKVWELKNKGFINNGKPIILIGDFWQPLIDMIAQNDIASGQYVNVVAGPEQARDVLVDYMRDR